MFTLIILGLCLAVALIPVAARILAHSDYAILVGITLLVTIGMMSWHPVFVILSIAGIILGYTLLLRITFFKIYIFRILITIPIIVIVSYQLAYHNTPDLIWRIFSFVILAGILLYVRFRDIDSIRVQ